MSDARPVLFVTNFAPTFRVGAFARLHAAEGVEFALIGGTIRHGGGTGDGDSELPFPVRHVDQRAVFELAASGAYRAVVAGLSGRLAPAAAYAGARRAGVPFVLWATMWAHPRTPAHALSYLPVRHLYRQADAVATYGLHVSAYVRGKGASGPIVEAPQSVDDVFWSEPSEPERHAPFQSLFSGRLNGEKGLAVLLEAWRASGLSASTAALVLVGGGPFRARAAATGAAVLAGERCPAEVRNLYAGSDVLVLPSIPTRNFTEPWGLAVNEAFNQGVPAIVSDAVGAAAGGLVRHEHTGLVVPAGDAAALAGALRRLYDDPALRARLGRNARAAVRAFTHDGWAAGMRRALASVGAGRAAGGMSQAPEREHRKETREP
jgi:glycosyltransferase involved in cell wall biosynthesis